MSAPSLAPPADAGPPRAGLAALGVACVAMALYALSGPGRIDMIDGQLRYEPAARWLDEGQPVVRDPQLRAVPGLRGQSYSRYGLGGTLTGMPFMALVPAELDPLEENRRFAFALSSAAGGALACAALLVLLVRLGVGLKPALGWTAACATATLLWPQAVSSFTHAQTAALATWAVALGVGSAQEKRPGLALWAGVLAGLLVTFDEYLALLVPVLGLAVLAPPGAGEEARPVRAWLAEAWRAVAWRPGADRRAAARYWLFAAGALVGMALFLGYNAWRFGNPLHSGKADNLREGHTFWGNPVEGLLSLLVSPGKGVLWFSPPVVLTLAGLRGLWRRAPGVWAAAVVGTGVVLAVVSPLSFFAGDWCWGPRYLVVTLPLWSAAWPFARGLAARRWPRRLLLAAGLAVQLLAVSLDHHRFFFERGLGALFWAQPESRGFYFQHSQLLARPAEVLRSWRERDEARASFVPNPYGLITYCPFGMRARSAEAARQWQQSFDAFLYWRPWPLWCDRLGARCPMPLGPLVGLFLGLGALGGALLWLASRPRR